MPIYEYGCKACHREFEYEQRMSDPEKTVCEACGGELERLISRTAFSLKGSGWYKDLYSSSKPEKPAETKTEAPKPEAPKTDSGSGGGSGTSKAAAAES